MPAQEKLSKTEQYLAYLAGLGIALTIVALLLIALGTIDNSDITTSLLLIGLAMIVLAIGGWLILLRPWEKYDDLQAPHYTGHGAHAKVSIPDVGISAPDVDLDMPSVDLKAPDVDLDMPSVDLKAPDVDLDMPSVDLKAPDVDLDMPSVDLKAPDVDLDMPSVDLKAPDVDLDMPSVDLKAPDVDLDMPSVDLKAPDVDLDVPSVDLKAPDIDVAAIETAESDVVAATSGPNDLTLIEGIGPKSSAALIDAGITTFARMAETSPEDLEKAIRDRKVRLVGSTETWPQQAKLAAEGKFKELEVLQDRLTGGILRD